MNKKQLETKIGEVLILRGKSRKPRKGYGRLVPISFVELVEVLPKGEAVVRTYARQGTVRVLAYEQTWGVDKEKLGALSEMPMTVRTRDLSHVEDGVGDEGVARWEYTL